MLRQRQQKILQRDTRDCRCSTYSPPYGFEKNPEEMDKIKGMIKEAKPHILIVGLGCPKQEKFMYITVRNWVCLSPLDWVQVSILRLGTLRGHQDGWQITA